MRLHDLSVTQQIMLIALAPLACLTIAFSALHLVYASQSSAHAAHGRALAMASFLAPAAEYGVFSRDQNHLEALLQTAMMQEGVIAVAILDETGLSAQAHIIAWNFFTDFDSTGDLGRPDAYQPGHINILLDQLRRDTIDALVVHSVADPIADARQTELALRWRDDGKVGRVGYWAPDATRIASPGFRDAFSFIVRPNNAWTPEAPQIFATAKSAGCETIGCSPFFRGWRFDALADSAARIEPSVPRNDHISRIAELLLRSALHQPNIDRLIVAMRRVDQVKVNCLSIHRGPLTESESAWLSAIL